MTLNGIMAVTLRYFTEFGKCALQKTICGGIYATVYCILVRVQCSRKESSRSLSHLLLSFLFSLVALMVNQHAKSQTVPKIWRGPNITKVGHVTLFPTLFDVILHFSLVALVASRSARQI